MAEKQKYVDLNMNQQEIKNVSLEKLATDPTGPGLYEGRFWENTTEDRMKAYLGGAIRVIPHFNEVNDIGIYGGTHDASTGIPSTNPNRPDTTIRAGDWFLVSVAGTIAGIQGMDQLSPGDILKALADSPAAAADFVGINQNIDDSLSSFTEEVAVASLPANTPTNVVFSNFTGRITSWKVLNNSGQEICVSVQRDTSPNRLVLESNVALSNLVVVATGRNS